jgi:hypothetical protein
MQSTDIMRALGLAVLLSGAAAAQGIYDEELLASRAIREQQWKQWDACLKALGPGVDFSNPEAFARSIAPLRRSSQDWSG